MGQEMDSVNRRGLIEEGTAQITILSGSFVAGNGMEWTAPHTYLPSLSQHPVDLTQYISYIGSPTSIQLVG